VERQRIAKATLVEILLHETGRVLGRDASFLGQQLEIRRRDDEPNWDANRGIAGPTVIKAFGIALTRVQAQHNLD